MCQRECKYNDDRVSKAINELLNFGFLLYIWYYIPITLETIPQIINLLIWFYVIKWIVSLIVIVFLMAFVGMALTWFKK